MLLGLNELRRQSQVGLLPATKGASKAKTNSSISLAPKGGYIEEETKHVAKTT